MAKGSKARAGARKPTRSKQAPRKSARSKAAAESRKGASAAPKRRKGSMAGLGLAPPSKLTLKPLLPGPAKSVKDATSALPKAVGAKGANTVIYVHGIGNKPIASVLKCQWDTALFGAEIGDRSRMAYWVDRSRYPTASNETCGMPDDVNVSEVSGVGIKALTGGQPGDETDAVEATIEALADNPQQKAFLTAIARKVQRATAQTGSVAAAGVEAKILPLPGFLRELIANQLTRVFLKDVHDFLFDAEKRDAMEKTLLDRLAPGGGPFIVVAHSQGSMIAYDVLRRLAKKDADVALFVTIGSPLGIQEVQDALRSWTGGSLPFPPCVTRWINVADRLDPVAADPRIDNDFEGTTKDEVRFFLNPDSPRHPHSATGYLRTKEVKDAVRGIVGTSFQQAIAPFAIAKDLVAEIEDGVAAQVHEVLIQLAGDRPGRPGSQKDLDAIAGAVIDMIGNLATAQGRTLKDANVERLRHFVVADLNRGEIEALRSSFKELKIDGIWRNAGKRALIMDSTNTVQAQPANLGYGADGRDITWAVLDTGIRGDHPHFTKHGNILAQWDSTKRGPAIEVDKDGSAKLDSNGHGTHVAGIIAGSLTAVNEKREPVTLAGMAPRCSLLGFKVLKDDGFGQDSYIIKALDTIAGINESAGQIVVHGVNLSLGGNFDVTAFGCGHSPLCQELRRLWRQGVLVCLAAGNEGYAMLRTDDGEIPANLDLTIGDPANLEEAIAVGSVHKTNPHTYGISYFSSRGPTADGRRKPDVVAPGEKIVSARHDCAKGVPTQGRPVVLTDYYVEMSGTSMAAPHVAGVLAAFLSHRREFIGYPDRVKALLLEGCIDLGRDPYFQGAGLPNLIKMLALN